MENKIKNTKVFLLDLDGTVYIGDKLIGSVKETLSFFRESGIKIVYLTNNSSRTEQEYIDKLTKLGVYNKSDLVYSSLSETINFIKSNYADKKFYAVATDKVKESLLLNGINLSDDADALLLAYDTSLTFEKLRKASDLLQGGAMFIVTHPDKVCPAPKYSMPDVGSFISLLNTATNRLPDVIIGKPNPNMAQALCKKFNVSLKEMTMIGDRLSTDIQFAVNAGVNSVLVLSGETTKEAYDKSTIRADLVADSINDLVKYFN